MSRKIKLKANEHEFHSLPGVKARRITGTMANSANGFIVALRKYRAVADAGDHGSVMVYVDDVGRYCCHFMRWCHSLETQQYKSQRHVRAWLKEWLPVQRQPKNH